MDRKKGGCPDALCRTLGTEYFEAIFTSVILVLTFCALPETYPPVLLKRKAQRLRSQDPRYWHPHESEKMKLGNIVTKYFSRPIRYVPRGPHAAATVAPGADKRGGLQHVLYRTHGVMHRPLRVLHLRHPIPAARGLPHHLPGPAPLGGGGVHAALPGALRGRPGRHRAQHRQPAAVHPGGGPEQGPRGPGGPAPPRWS